MKACEHFGDWVIHSGIKCPMCEMENEIEELRKKSDKDDAEIRRMEELLGEQK